MAQENFARQGMGASLKKITKKGCCKRAAQTLGRPCMNALLLQGTSSPFGCEQACCAVAVGENARGNAFCHSLAEIRIL